MKINFAIDQNVSRHLAFALILVLAFFVVFITTSKAQEIIRNSRDSETFNFQKRAQAKIPENQNMKSQIANDK